MPGPLCAGGERLGVLGAGTGRVAVGWAGMVVAVRSVCVWVVWVGVWVAGWLVGWVTGWMAGWMVGWLDWVAGCVAGWWAGCLAGWLGFSWI